MKQTDRVSLTGLQTTVQEVRVEVDKQSLLNKAYELRDEVLADFVKRKLNEHYHKLAGYSKMTSTEYYVKEDHLWEVDGFYDYHHRESRDSRIRKLTPEEVLELHNVRCGLAAAVQALSPTMKRY